MYKVCLLGASFDTGNQGVSALAASLLGIISALKPEAQFSFFIGSRQRKMDEQRIGDRTIKYEIINYRLSPKASLKEHIFYIFFMALIQRVIPIKSIKKKIIDRVPVLREINDIDWIGDIRGGDGFSDIYGVRGFVMGSIPDAIVLFMEKRLYFLPQTYGPYRSPISKLVAKVLLKRSKSILSRDKEGLDVVKGLIGKYQEKVEVKFCPDVAFSMSAVAPNKLVIEPPLCRDSERSFICGLNVSGLLYNGGFTRKNMFGLKLDYQRFVHLLSERILKDTSGQLLLIPHTFAPEGQVESDPDACREVWKGLTVQYQNRVHLVVEEYDQSEIKNIIGMCDFFIGSRMHACIAALSQGIPTVGVAYSRKFHGVFSSIGVGDMILDARTTDLDEAIGSIMDRIRGREETGLLLQEKVQRAKVELGKTFRQILDPDSNNT
jgi:polysaccharide pyruvyl transferase WcaK-like protein